MSFSDAVLINPSVYLERNRIYPFVDMSSINANYRFVQSSVQRKFRGGGSKFKNGDTLMARITPCLENGKIARYHALDDASEIAHGSTEFIVIRGRPSITDTEYAYYLTQWNKVQNYAISQMSGTSGRQRVPTNSLDHLLVLIPPLSEQLAICNILGTLNDKIELNRQMSETLESIARALFKSWFIDFDPVRAKMEGRWRRGESLPGLPANLWDLFPDQFLESELGKIPNGWEIGSLGDILQQRCTAKRERCYVSKETASRPYLPIDCISPKSLFLTRSKHGREAKSSLIKFYKGDLIFGAMRPYYHKVCIAPFEGTTRTTAFVLYPKQECNFAFATLLLHDKDTINFATQNSRGSTIPYAIWANSLETMPIIIPTENILEAFNNTVQLLLMRISQFYFQFHTLVTLRDALLPNLLSGKLRIEKT